MAKVLVADGNREAADVLADALRLNGHAARTCYTSRQCFTVTHDFRPDVVVLRPSDIDAEVLRQLRTVAPVITIGFDGDLKEPIDMLLLMQLIRRRLA
jgi:DNA-binding response OmpR family regulator